MLSICVSVADCGKPGTRLWKTRQHNDSLKHLITLANASETISRHATVSKLPPAL